MITERLTDLSLLGAAPTGDLVEFVTEFGYVPEGWYAVGLGALVLLICWFVVWMYRHEGRIGASTRRRMVLAGIRCSVLVMLAIICLDPVRVRILRRWVDSYTIVLVDSSSSMGLADTYPTEETADRVRKVMGEAVSLPIRRSDVVDRLLGSNDRRFLQQLAANNRLRLFAFSDKPTLHATVRASREESASDAAPSAMSDAAEISTSFAPTGSVTNIDQSLRRAVESLGSAPIAGVVVLSDGGFNEGAPVAETARYAADRALPVYVVGIGDPTVPKNVRVVEVMAPDNAFVGDPIAITAQLVTQGVSGQSIKVELHERLVSGGAPGRVVDTRDVVPAAGGAVEPITFRRRQGTVGRYVYTVQVSALSGETILEDNSRQKTVNIIEARTKVLLIAGGPSWEYRFVSRLLQRDDSFDLSCWLQSADVRAVRDGNTVIDHLPFLPEELFAYDVIILMDPDKAEFDESWCRLADTFVSEYGGGLLLAAARARTPGFLREPRFKPLHDLLPVTFDLDVDLVLNTIGHYQLRGSPVEIPPQAVGHPVMRQADDAVSTRLIWNKVAEVFWHYPVLREKPAATVLMRHGNSRMRNSFGGHVIAAVQYVGAGRTAFLGIDGTWRWRRYGDALFNRFWVQMIRHLAEGKLLGGSKRGTLLTDGEQFALGDAVTVTARLVDSRYEPIKQDVVDATYVADGEERAFSLTAQAERPGWFEGRFVPDHTGVYRIVVRLPKAKVGETVEISRDIRVTRPNVEILRPQMDRDALRTLATGSAGGRYFEIDEASELPGLIPDRHEEIAVRSRPTALWDNGTVMIVLLGLLSVEWFVRKWSRLL